MKFIISGILFIWLLSLAACTDEQELTKEQILMQSIVELERRFEERKLSKIVEFVSVNYQDNSGRKLKDIKRAIQMQIMRHTTLYVFSTIQDIQWHNDENATVKITAAMGGKPMKSASILTSVRADMINFTVEFVLEDKVYKIKSAIWTRAEPSDFF